MTVSPDLPGFQSVNVSDLDVTDPADLVDLALARGQVLLPEWTPREGNVEVVLLEEFAVLVSLLATRLEVIVPAVTMQVLAMSGLARYQGSPAALEVQVDLSDTLGHIVPAGTSVVVGDPNAEAPITGTLQGDVVVASGSSTGTGVVVMDAVGVVDGLTTSTEVLLIDAVAYVDSITVTDVTSAGTDPETDDQYLARGSAWLRAMTALLGRPDQFAAAALADVRVGRALGVNRWDGSGTVGAVAGNVTVLLVGRDGQALTSTVRGQIRDALAAKAVTELVVSTKTPTVTSVPVTAAVTLLPGYVAAAVTAAVQDAIEGYLDPLTWPWGEAVRRSRLQQVIETVPGVDAATITAPAADVTIGALHLVRHGTVTVTV